MRLPFRHTGIADYQPLEGYIETTAYILRYSI